ncbi:MAG: hypothetical protein LBD60_00950 [Puniceicoccales bacterium]|jgi:hypothetical protein|nr:hypothetical protein [Puniceicoccales bacterium]
MSKKSIIKASYKTGVILLSSLAFSSMDFGSTDPEMELYRTLSVLNEKGRLDSEEHKEAVALVLDGSTPAEEAVQILALLDSKTQQDIAQKMSPQRLEAIKQQGLAYQQDPLELLRVIAIMIYHREVKELMEKPGNEADQIAEILAFLEQKTRRGQQGRDPIVREAQRRLECLQNNGLLPPRPKTVYRIVGGIRLAPNPVKGAATQATEEV